MEKSQLPTRWRREKSKNRANIVEIHCRGNNMTSELRALVKQQNLLYYDKMKAEPTAHTFIVRHVPWKVAAGKLTAPQPCIHLCDRAFIIEALSNPFTSNRFVASIHGCLAHCSIDSADSNIRQLHW